jgi:hypothetical protein
VATSVKIDFEPFYATMSDKKQIDSAT